MDINIEALRRDLYYWIFSDCLKSYKEDALAFLKPFLNEIEIIHECIITPDGLYNTALHFFRFS